MKHGLTLGTRITVTIVQKKGDVKVADLYLHIQSCLCNTHHSDGISGVAYIPAKARSWHPPGDRSLPRRKPASSPRQSPAWLKAQVCPAT